MHTPTDSLLTTHTGYFVGTEAMKQKNPLAFSDEPGPNEDASMFTDYEMVELKDIDYSGTRIYSLEYILTHQLAYSSTHLT